ncbi:branched-chain amino acid ABC transporter permease [Billgrantia kenyensis]|uniref:Branched-chain amino acid ABC transporter permease n=1 Tax=Billgrantia kenyensis TaxID=321266 RepID=A0A7V9VYV3_9GAMM|nr:branched-chain amino acid ABC transporter permease [Halomonas kenyensis]MBA2777920.1 branched-chain amino acid ABC transporter permease [Halomonas kenyensis]MCG6661391.1 branched-chain amino acid ABC transporter permease [Halomonas kenyensis]
MKREHLIILAIVALLVAWPLLMGNYAVSQANRAMIYALAALSFSLLAGRLGWFSLCQTTFAGISGYTIAILGVRYGLPFPLLVTLALLFTAVSAVIFGLLTVRSRQVSFLMLTLALGQMVWALSFQWVDVTGGYNGIAGVRMPVYGDLNLNDTRVFYVLVATVTVAIFLAVWRLYRSPFGLLLLGIQENEQRMRALGHPVYLARFTAFVLAGMIGGVAGVFLVYDMGIMSPSPLGLGHAVWVLTAAVLGGYRTLLGPALGVAVLIALETLVSQYTDRHMMVIGLVLLLSILLMPRGLAEVFEQYFKRKSKPQASVTTTTRGEEP